MKQKYLSYGRFAALLTVGLPMFASAQSLVGIIGQAKMILDLVIPIIFSIALIFFLWNLTEMIWTVGKNKADARDHMIMGLIVLAVMAGVWGLVNLITTSVGVGQGGTVIVPRVP